MKPHNGGLIVSLRLAPCYTSGGMAEEIVPFDEGAFESSGKENGTRYWYARDLMVALGYESFDSFEKAVNRASKACLTLNIPLGDTIDQIEREIDGRPHRDYKLSRFGCYLVAVNGDPKKPQVAAAQAYFVTLADAFRQYLQQGGSVERVLLRDDITERERSLSGIASEAGVENYSFFQSAGYRGLYNMSLAKLRDMRSIDRARSPLDFMGRTELAANLFRITQTEEKIKNEKIHGQIRLEQAAESVGRSVRQTMLRTGGTAPERLPKAADIKDVRKGLKGAHKEIDGSTEFGGHRPSTRQRAGVGSAPRRREVPLESRGAGRGRPDGPVAPDGTPLRLLV